MSRVLVVDDAQVMRRAVEKMLQPDYDIVLANDGEAGWDTLVQDDQIEMLITDIQMPLLDGYGLICARARRWQFADPRTADHHHHRCRGRRDPGASLRLRLDRFSRPSRSTRSCCSRACTPICA
ncbi:MAG: response regulator [Comamonadaceae bacterium]|nr:response regulator [Comamonadaceae bacterium]